MNYDDRINLHKRVNKVNDAQDLIHLSSGNMKGWADVRSAKLYCW
jgi:hypothetical protein